VSAAPRAGGAAALALAAGVALAGFAPPRAALECGAPVSRLEAGGRTVEVGCGAGGALQGPARLLYGLRLDPNRAPASDLEALPQVGPARAQALLQARAGRPFCSPSDLERVPGIGPSRRKALESWLEFAETSGCRGAPTGRRMHEEGGSATVR
jgi:competence protein ComEA